MTTLLTGGRASGREVLDDDVDLARDRVLVTRAQGGDRSAFDDLYQRYYRRLYRFCLRRLHDSHEAEDVAQEAFARAWRALPSFGGDRRFYPWLSVIASHLCTDVLRRRNRSTPVAEFHQANVASTEDGGEELVVAAVDSALVAKAFTRLSDRHQRILNLREGSGWSYQRIADHEGVGITAVETLLWRARQALKREFATLAGSEGRMGAWLAALLSAGALRRFFRLPTRMLRRSATTGAKGAVVAMGSAVATAAMVIGAAMSSSPASTAPGANGLADGPGAFVPGQVAPTSAALLPLIASSPAASSSAAAAAGGDAATSSNPAGGLSNLTGSGQNPLGGALQNSGGTLLKVGEGVENAGNTLGTTLNGTVAGVASTVSGAASTVAGAAGTVSGAAGQVLGAAGSATQPVANALNQTVTSLLDGSASASSVAAGLLDPGSSAGTADTSSSPSSSTASSTGSSASDPIDSADNLANNLLGGL